MAMLRCHDLDFFSEFLSSLARAAVLHVCHHSGKCTHTIVTVGLAGSEVSMPEVRAITIKQRPQLQSPNCGTPTHPVNITTFPRGNDVMRCRYLTKVCMEPCSWITNVKNSERDQLCGESTLLRGSFLYRINPICAIDYRRNSSAKY